MKKINVNRIIRITAAVLLVIMIFEEPAQRWAQMKPYFIDEVQAATADSSETDADALGDADSTPMYYVSDVRLFDAMNWKDAKKSCEKAGYTLVDSDLNEGTQKDWVDTHIYGSDDAAYVYLGYKTSTNPDDAITDMKMVEMDTGYTMMNYEDLEKEMNPSMNILAVDIMVAVSEAKNNLAAGDSYAEAAKRYLNMYYIPYLDSRLLGDFLFSDNLDLNEVSKLLKRTNPAVISCIMSALAMGVSQSDVPGYDGNFAARMAAASYDITAESKSEYKVLDGYYYDAASSLKDALQDFANKIESALAIYNNTGKRLDDDFIKDHAIEASYVSIYNKLNEYVMSDGKGVGECLVDAGSGSLNTRQELRKIYPLVMALTAGQLAMFQYTGPSTATGYMDGDSSALNFADEKFKEATDEIKNSGLEQTEDGKVPVYAADNDTLYKSEVAMTNEATRAASAKNEYNYVSSVSFSEEAWAAVFKWGFFVIDVCFVMCIITMIVTKIVTYFVAQATIAAFMSTTAGACLSVMGSAISAVGSNIVTLIIFIVVMVVWYAYNKIKAHKEYLNPDYSQVPHFLDDIIKIANADGEEDTKHIMYNAVYNVHDDDYQKDWMNYTFQDSVSTINKAKANNKDLYSDFNAKQGKKWNALYVTKDKDAGSPICSTNPDDIFLVKKGEYNEHISGYEGFTEIGNTGPVNLNSNQYNDDVSGIYLYYRTKERMEDPDAVVYSTKGKYISDLVIVSEKDENKAKAAIKMKKEKYTFLDQNLTPDQGYYTFIGYATTNYVKDALTDIRLDCIDTGNSAAGGYTRGNVSYGRVGTTGNGLTLYQSAMNVGEEQETEEGTYVSAPGAPILADMIITDDINKAPAGYEPIILGGGGAAYNFNTRYNKNDDKNRRYVYFQPSVAYVPESAGKMVKENVTYVYSDTKYISGINAFASGSLSKSKLLNRIRSMGYTVAEYDLMEGWEYPEYKIRSYLGYSTTYNPYRAISDVKYFKGSTYSSSIQYCAGSGEGTYLAADVHLFTGESCRGLSTSKAYCGYCNEMIAITKSLTNNLQLGRYEEVEKWQGLNIKYYFGYAVRGLFTLGVDADHPALKESDISISRNSSAPKGMRSISLMTDWYSKTNFDISIDYGVHFYIKRDALSKGKYIKSIYVASFEEPDVKGLEKLMAYRQADDYTMLAAVGGSDGEILKTNIAVDQNYAWYNLLDGKDGDDIVYDGSGVYTMRVKGVKKYLYDLNKASLKLPKPARAYSYVGITRTNDPNEALTGIVKYKCTSDQVPAKISIGGVKYYKAGDRVGDYCFYTTTSLNSSPGFPITDLYFDGSASAGGESAVLTTEKTDPSDLQQKLDAIDKDKSLKPYEKIVKKAELKNSYVDLRAESYKGLYGHVSVETNNTFISELFIGHGKSMSKAASDVIKQGAKFVYSYNLNMGATGEVSANRLKWSKTEFMKDKSLAEAAKYWYVPRVDNNVINDYVVIGYNLEIADDEYTGEDEAVRDILLTVGEPYKEDGFTQNGCEYYPVSDTSLNYGAYGKDIYMYMTYDEPKGGLSPIAGLAIARNDSIPASAGKKRYEYVLSTTGDRANLNEGVKAIKSRKYRYTRLWLFANRLDNTVKKNARLDITDAGRNTTRMNVKLIR